MNFNIGNKVLFLNPLNEYENSFIESIGIIKKITTENNEIFYHIDRFQNGKLIKINKKYIVKQYS